VDRQDAGRALAAKLDAYRGRPDVLVLGLPRGGVPVAAEVARALGVPLDVLLVRKLGVPSQPELAMGAIAEGGAEVLNRDLIQQLGLPPAVIEAVAARERSELERRLRVYRSGRPAASLAGRVVLLVDDGLATGATMEAAITAVRRQKATEVVVAVPVGARDTCERLRPLADAVIAVEAPLDLGAVGRWYDDFSQTSDDEVTTLLASANDGAAQA
jgi:predicted phosphoribosyltransferase